jgi:hypothetical protein
MQPLPTRGLLAQMPSRSDAVDVIEHLVPSDFVDVLQGHLTLSAILALPYSLNTSANQPSLTVETQGLSVASQQSET